MTDQGKPREITDPATLRALRHPLRRQLLRLLHRDGPATATDLAKALGENTGATSYHLRQLAEHGLVAEDPERGRGRERWWQAVPHDLRFPPRSRMDPDLRAAFDALERVSVDEDEAALARFERQRDQLGPWGDALLFSRGEVKLTLEQAKQFFDDYLALLTRYLEISEHAPDGEDEARRMHVRWTAFPDVD
ncbi:helix-turn-helix domain-containing protein [Amycolatopsis suaedae]|uniref:Transcriptional regulator n=1 Tax=Amycolatopsis suaedae TaxID=2510978 RepID=A0A4Q7J4W8_9PSEU|nr:helix-turn-helix domain-containing protein [Amycolatopsis suaedae]RZQ61343.1 transcriptional regulator [Amycolatopsis suaedae]